MVSYCSTGNNRSLTKYLIEASKKSSSSRSFHNFMNKSQWIDGLDIWSLNNINHSLKSDLEFDQDIGIYLPKLDKTNLITKSNLICLNEINESFKEVFEKEEKEEKDLNNSSMDENFSKSEENQTIKSNSKKNCSKNCSNKIRFPLRQIQSENSSRENKLKENSESINREKMTYFFKEQISNLFIKETKNINSKRSIITIPSVQIKHQNIQTKTIQQTDSTSIIQKYNQIQQFLISPSSNQSILINKKQSTMIFHEISNLSLTGIPLDFSSSKTLSEDQIFQHENPLLTTIRPSTQPVFRPSSIEENEQQNRFSFKHNIQTNLISSSRNSFLSNPNSIDEQTQKLKKSRRYHRALSTNINRKKKTSQLLPYIKGKRIYVNLYNQKCL